MHNDNNKINSITTDQAQQNNISFTTAHVLQSEWEYCEKVVW